MVKPSVSVIIPAFNAADTLLATVQSLFDQTRPDWEAIIVDDGSTDRTAEVAMALANQDSRIHLERQPNAGASSARNTGLKLARSRHVMFLDADDWIFPTYAEKMIGALEQIPEASIAYCGYQSISPRGLEIPVRPVPDLNAGAFKFFAQSNVVAIHCFVLPRDLVLAVGGFDDTLITCEDWDLWLKLARTDPVFVEVRECLAFYLLRPGSLSRDGRQMVRDAQTVIRRVQRPDPRVPEPADQYVEGFIDRDAYEQAAYFACWCAALEGGCGNDRSDFLDELDCVPDMKEHPAVLINVVVDALAIGMETAIARLAEQADIFDGPLSALFKRLGHASSWPGLSFLLWSELSIRLLWENDLKTPARVGVMLGQRVDILDIQAIVPPSGVETIYLRICAGDNVLRDRIVPLWGKLAKAEVAELVLNEVGQETFFHRSGLRSSPRFWPSLLREAGSAIPELFSIALSKQGGRRRRVRRVLDNFNRRALMRLTGGTARSNAKQLDGNYAHALETVEKIRSSVRERLLEGAESLPATQSSTIEESAFEPNRRAFWERLFQKPDPWNYTSPYEQLKYEQTLALLPEQGIGTALELACAEGLFTRLLAPKVDRLIAADISSTALERARVCCADLDNVQFYQLDLVDDALPNDLDLLVCSEVLYYLRDRQQLVEIARKFHDALKPGGLFLTAHAMVLSDDVTRTGFDWEGHFGGAKTMAEVFATTDTLQLMKSLQTELYRIDLYRRALPGETTIAADVCLADFARHLDLDVERFVIWGGAVARRETLRATEKVRQVPILMYHRIADEGPAELSRYRTTSSAFEDQLRLLRRYGYHSITSPELEFYLRSGQPLPGRPVMITFDDGYQDFYDTAWPILRRNDFTAEVFIVSDKVGHAADWDLQYGPPSPLMDWPAIRELRAQGVRFGSHLASHSAASTLALDVLLRETTGSRAVLEQKLGCDVTSIAPPFGIIDDRLWRCMELTGYTTAFTTEDRIATLSDHPLFLPRVEVFGGEDLAAFAKRIGLAIDETGQSR